MKDLKHVETLETSGGYGWYPGFDAKKDNEALKFGLHQAGDFIRGLFEGLFGDE